jgi:hypothetical protein
MRILGVGLIWVSYAVGMWGYCLIRGYDVTLLQLVKPAVWTGTWPPFVADNTVIFPVGKGAAGGVVGSSSDFSTTAPATGGASGPGADAGAAAGASGAAGGLGNGLGGVVGR